MARKYVRVGTDDRGDAYRVGIELAEVNSAVEFTNHELGTLKYRLSISGEVVEPGWAEPVCCGQIVDELEKVTTPARGWTMPAIKRLIEIWREWHLNDMNAASDEQREAGWTFQTHAGQADSTGYKIGSKWLARELPEDVLRDVRALTSTAADRAKVGV